MVNTRDFPTKEESDLDYGKSLKLLQLEYTWDKAAADLAANLARAAALQLYRR